MSQKVKACLYVSYSQESMTIFLCKFDSNLWNKIWNEICDKYDCDNPLKPIHLENNKKKLKEDLEKYIKSNVTFLCELPSVKATKMETGKKIQNQYALPNKHTSSNSEKENIVTEISEKCKEAKTITNESFQLCRKKLLRF